MTPNVEYRRRQFGTVIVVTTVLAVALIVALFAGSGRFFVLPAAVLVILLAVLLLFFSLKVEIGDGVLRCVFGIGLIRKEIPLTEIESARPVSNPWYAGWGIRWRPGRYLLWNVSGLRAVELELKNGARFRIGTDEPEALARAIESARAQRREG